MKHKKYKGIKPSEHFKIFKEGDRVALIKNPAFKGNFPRTFLGRTGLVSKKIDSAYEVRFLNGKSYKNLVIKPVHLKKIN